ncbi:MAG: YitT family protein [Oscillospiraceae bacterium]|nr:YitT family protein [Oscillospiraceae bacterium]
MRTRHVIDGAVIFAGAFCYAAAVVVFIAPNVIPLGGVTGIALLLGGTLSLPVGTLTLLLNLPLFWLSLRFLGRNFLVRTLAATVLSSLLLDALAPLAARWALTYSDNPLLAALYGGVLSGAGLGLVFSRGATTGGSDILARLLRLKWERVGLGRLNLIVNAVVVLISALVYRSLESALYALVVQYVTSVVMDSVLMGQDNAAAAFIITRDPARVSDALLHTLGRGVTSLSGTGMYSREARAALLCAVRGHEITQLKRLVAEADADAFLIVMSAREVLGRGFKRHETLSQ